MAHPVKAKVLLAAAEVLGGRLQLRSRLGVSSATLHAWLSGAADPPRDAFLQAVMIILADLESREGRR